MKKSLIYSGIVVATTTATVATVQSCTTLGTVGTVGTAISAITIVKNILSGGTSKGLGILGNANLFNTDSLIEAALPKELKDINNKLENIGLGHLVTKEKQYIGQVAGSTVDIARPIITNAIQNITPQDAANILAGGKGAATQYLKQKTQQQLVTAIAPKVEQELNKLGFMKTFNAASSNSGIVGMLGNILGGGGTSNTVTGGLSNLVTQQIVNGFFNVVGDYENKNYSSLNQLGGILQPAK